MQIDRIIKLFSATLLLLLIPFVQAPADPIVEPSSGNSDTLAQLPSETPTTQPGKTPAEGGGNTSAEGGGNNTPAEGGENNEGRDHTFKPSESISADSAIAFPVDI